MSTFAIPNEKRGTQSLKFGTNKFIEKTDLLYKKQVPRKNNLSRSVNSFEGIISVRSDWKYKYYTMKSLILAQDER